MNQVNLSWLLIYFFQQIITHLTYKELEASSQEFRKKVSRTPLYANLKTISVCAWKFINQAGAVCHNVTAFRLEPKAELQFSSGYTCELYTTLCICRPLSNYDDLKDDIFGQWPFLGHFKFDEQYIWNAL